MTIKAGNSDEFLGRFRFDRTPYFFGFESLGDLVDHVAALPKPSDENNSAGWERKFRDFTGSEDMRDAIHLARTGWQRGLERAETIARSLSAATATKPLRVSAIAGGSVNVGLMLAGNPAHMRRRAPMPGKRVVTLFVENCASSGISADILVKRAAMIAATCDILERAGYSCEIVAIVTVTLGDVNSDRLAHQFTVKIKNAGERLNLADTVFSFGHPSFLRRFVFAIVGSTPGLRSIWESQGYPGAAFENDTKEYYFPMLQVEDLRKVNTNDNLAFFKFLLPKGLDVAINS